MLRKPNNRRGKADKGRQDVNNGSESIHLGPQTTVTIKTSTQCYDVRFFFPKEGGNMAFNNRKPSVFQCRANKHFKTVPARLPVLKQTEFPKHNLFMFIKNRSGI